MNWPDGADLIAAERRRQIEAEGWSIEHDREHGWKSLRMAAWAYEDNNRSLWPWGMQWWKPKGPLRNLVRAGALYQAAADVADADGDRDYLYTRRDDVAAQIDQLLDEVKAIDPVEVAQGHECGRDYDPWCDGCRTAMRDAGEVP